MVAKTKQLFFLVQSKKIRQDNFEILGSLLTLLRTRLHCCRVAK